ncbi:MAG: FKBP-type peptidyl-prolyl cis-trans isomerase [Paramuribaculum sp.]|nr:FKBP-type peptidyl-prolyl cis-trans isomerase [Paramuribaculum sp.]
MKKTLFAIAMSAVALVPMSCAKNSESKVSAEDQAFNDSLAMVLGRGQGAMLNQNMDQLPADERAKFEKKSFLRGFKEVIMADTSDVAYQYGIQIGLGFARQIKALYAEGVDINRAELIRYFSQAFLQDSINSTQLGMDMNEMQRLMGRVQEKSQARQMEAAQAQQAAREAEATENEAKGAEFVAAQVKADPSIKTTESGLAYKVNQAGTGATPTETSKVTVHYTGKLIDGTVFDSSVERGEPATFGVTEVVPGFGEGLKLMNKGAKYTLYIPANLAYGNNAAGSIPPGSTLIFDVEVLDITE